MHLPQTVELKGIRVLTTEQIAEAYEVKEIQIHQNFKNNRARFVDGKHYISLSGDELKAFKNHLEKIEVVKNRTSHLYLWTEKGALLHAKSLNTDKAWEVYDYLVDFYFRAKEKPEPVKQGPVPVTYINEKPQLPKSESSKEKEPYDIAPDFRRVIAMLPIEALDEMEKIFRGNKSQAIKLAATSILAEKMKRQLI